MSQQVSSEAQRLHDQANRDTVVMMASAILADPRSTDADRQFALEALQALERKEGAR